MAFYPGQTNRGNQDPKAAGGFRFTPVYPGRSCTLSGHQVQTGPTGPSCGADPHVSKKRTLQLLRKDCMLATTTLKACICAILPKSLSHPSHPNAQSGRPSLGPRHWLRPSARQGSAPAAATGARRLQLPLRAFRLTGLSKRLDCMLLGYEQWQTSRPRTHRLNAKLPLQSGIK